jgi:carbamoyltransferase
MVILGISAFYHDAAAALVIDGKIVAAAQEERFTRRKHDAAFPEKAIGYCLAEAGVTLDDVDHVVFYEKPFLKFDRLLENYLGFAPLGFASFSKAIPEWLGRKLWVKSKLKSHFPGKSVLFSKHHISHGASSFYPSPFERAAVVTCDGVGEWATASIAVGEGKKFDILQTIAYPHSLGLLYSAFTYFTGFRVNSGEYKLMGLAPYGRPLYADLIREQLVNIREDGSFQLNLQYFGYPTSLRMTNRRFAKLFGVEARTPESQIDVDLAASIQIVTEEIVLNLVRAAHRLVGGDNLCLAGGVALNCVANGRVLREGPFKNVWIQPAAGDAGGALGAAQYVSHHVLGEDRPAVEAGGDRQNGSYLGPSFSTEEAVKQLKASGATFEILNDRDLIDRAARELADGKVLGWFQGRMEFGPRALGNRSILGNPLLRDTQTTMNLKIKFRESFRPFAPSVLEEDLSEYFELDRPSPYMLLVAPVAEKYRRNVARAEPAAAAGDHAELMSVLKEERSRLPGITHVDYSARIQTVNRSTNRRYHDLISKFRELSGCSVLVNTSYNVRGEPIVCTPADAYRCFLRTNMDYLVVENVWIEKSKQKARPESDDWRSEFKLD